MAIPRLRTEDGNSYCSNCNSQIEGIAASCPKCGKAFDGQKDANHCPSCGVANLTGSISCLRCGKVMKPGRFSSTAPTTTKSKVEAVPKKTESVVNPDLKGGVDNKGLKQRDVEETKRRTQSLWELSEPFEKVIKSRRRRLSKINSLLERARERLASLEGSGLEEDTEERERLKRQIDEIMEEKEEIIRIEEGIAEMERIYRNLLSLQETELKKKQESLRIRIQSFEEEIEKRDSERDNIRSREEALRAREREFRNKITEIEQRESALTDREKGLKDKMRTLRKEELDMMKRKFMGESSSLPTQKGWVENEGGIKPEVVEVDSGDQPSGPGNDESELNTRITKLEEEVQRIAEEKDRLKEMNRTIAASQKNVKKVLKILDDLLERLPDEDIKKFADSEEFKLYEKVLENFEL